MTVTTMIEDIYANIDADQALERIAHLEKIIRDAQKNFDDFKAHYEAKIASAAVIRDADTADARQEISLLTEKLRRFAEINLPTGKRSVKLPSGTLSFRKQSPKFFFTDLKEADGHEPRLINFVKHHANNYLKVKVEESVDWAKFKSKLAIDGDNVYYAVTGEIIDDLHAQALPDKFTVQTS